MFTSLADFTERTNEINKERRGQVRPYVIVPYIGAVLLRSSMESAGLGHVEVTPFDEIDDGDFLICSAGMGSPAIGIEKIPNGSEYLRAFRGLESHIGMKASHVSPVEIGGINSLMPLVVAVHSGLPVADGDGEGRAFPELQMTTFCGYGYSASPVCLVDERANSIPRTRTRKTAGQGRCSPASWWQ